VTATLDYKEAETDPEDAAVRITVKNLRGGHSGLEIHEGRGNANKLMVQMVREAIEELDARLASWHGGNMRNAIPFKAETILTLPKENVEALKELADDWKDTFNDEFKLIEPQGIEIIVEEVETPKTEIPEEIQDNIVDAIYACHDGVIRFIPAYPNVVETSSNLAIINIGGGHADIKILARSSREDMKDYVVKTLESCFSMAGMKVETAGSYGGWDPNPDSEILHLLLKEYKELFGADGIIQVDHAGLECSVILGKYPWLDVVSLGPTMKSPHTTTERALIETVEPFWKLLKKTLEDVPEK
jgi:dipeptidase D